MYVDRLAISYNQRNPQKDGVTNVVIITTDIIMMLLKRSVEQ
jgi:hypothetical protein